MLALFVLAAALPRSDELPVRVYVTQAPAILANLEANPELRARDFEGLVLQVLLQEPEKQLGALAAVTATAARLGVPIIPGFRTMETRPDGGYHDAERWARNTRFLRLVAATLPARGDRRLAIDLEAYQRNTGHAELERAKVVMKPFLDALVELRVTPIIYPADPRAADTQLIADAVGGRLELWCETNFTLSEVVRRGDPRADAIVVKLARFRTEVARRWPEAVVRHSSNDDLLRSWGATMRERVIDFGPWGPWIFVPNKPDVGKLGTPDWARGVSRASLNDAALVWRVDTKGRLRAQVGAIAPSPVSRARLGIYETKDVLDAKDMTICVEAKLPPSGDGPIVSTRYLSWQIRLEGPRAVLDLHRAGAEPIVVPVRSEVSRGAPIRLCAARGKDGWYTAESAKPTLAGVEAPGTRLRLSYSSMPRSRATVELAGLEVIQLELWRRALAPKELELAQRSGWPW